jgi:extracellular matrix protein 14
MEAGLGVAKAMKVDHGTQYKTGQACDLVYRAAGDSIDYAYGDQGIRWAYSAELRDTGTVSGLR